MEPHGGQLQGRLANRAYSSMGAIPHAAQCIPFVGSCCEVVVRAMDMLWVQQGYVRDL